MVSVRDLDDDNDGERRRFRCLTDWRQRLGRHASANSSEVEGWHYQLVGITCSQSRSRLYVSDAGEVGRHDR